MKLDLHYNNHINSAIWAQAPLISILIIKP